MCLFNYGSLVNGTWEKPVCHFFCDPVDKKIRPENLLDTRDFTPKNALTMLLIIDIWNVILWEGEDQQI